MAEIKVTLATLESHNHIAGDIERGVEAFNRGGVEYEQREPNAYWARVPHKGTDSKAVTVTFTRDGQDIGHHYCDCSWRSGGDPVCRHVVAAVLAIQGGIAESNITLGKSASVETVVVEGNTASSMRSGSLPVFATPAMIALMEEAACACLADCLEPGQTSVGTKINATHTAASPLGTVITATAVIKYVFGSRIEFTVTAHDGEREIGCGEHSRAIVDEARFMSRIKGIKR